MKKMTESQFNVLPTNATALPDLHATPCEVARLWPSDVPLLALIASESDSPWARWSILAPATGRRLTLDGPTAMTELSATLEKSSSTSLLPNWIGYLSYELGYTIEPTSGVLPTNNWPLVDLMWCDRALVHDKETNSWWSIGNLEPPDVKEEIIFDFHCDALHDANGSNSFMSAVQRTIDYIHEGDIFQANITRRFTAIAHGNIRAAALSLLQNPGGWFGAWIEFPNEGRFLLSMSPELFLQVDAHSQKVITRPMKGTRPETDTPETLLESSKDAAELHMIVDLMRNDLGKVCKFGTMHVQNARSIEQHPTVWQCVGEVCGTLRNDVSICDVIQAAFPAGSVTGAPKIRAMQIINELEHTPRGPYCGTIGVLGNSAMLSVAIRTAMFSGSKNPTEFQGTMEYSTGCGIVAESNPTLELEESEVKTHILRSLYDPCVTP